MAQQNFALGTVGWDQDPNYYDIGTAGTDKCLVKVTLVWGRNPSATLTGTNAQGAKMLACLQGPVFQLPPLGALVTLGIPEGMERMPGASTITGWHQATPTGFSATNGMIPVADGQTFAIGDANAAALAFAASFQQLITDLKSVTPSAQETGLAALQTKLTTDATGKYANCATKKGTMT